MDRSKSDERITKIESIEARLARDPRGLERVTLAGGMIFRSLRRKQAEAGEPGEVLDNDVLGEQAEEEGE